jgi:hypothetical protein
MTRQHRHVRRPAVVALATLAGLALAIVASLAGTTSALWRVADTAPVPALTTGGVVIDVQSVSGAMPSDPDEARATGPTSEPESAVDAPSAPTAEETPAQETPVGPDAAPVTPSSAPSAPGAPGALTDKAGNS